MYLTTLKAMKGSLKIDSFCQEMSEQLILNKHFQFERHKKFVGDYILYYGGQMADFRRSV